MPHLHSRLLLVAAFVVAAVAGRAITITNFLLDNQDELNAVVRWDPTSPGSYVERSMLGCIQDGDGDPQNDLQWEQHNGGVAFLSLQRMGATLKISSWGTDTDGQYDDQHIDIFTVAIDLTQPFTKSFVVASPHGVYDYHFMRRWSDPYSFRIHAGNYLWTDVPDSGLTLAMLGGGVGTLVLFARRWRR